MELLAQAAPWHDVIEEYVAVRGPKLTIGGRGFMFIRDVGIVVAGQKSHLWHPAAEKISNLLNCCWLHTRLIVAGVQPLSNQLVPQLCIR